MKVVLQGHIIVPDTDLDAVRRELDAHIRLTRLEDGCLCFEVTPDSIDPNRFHVYEEFKDRASFERHQQRVGSSSWGKATGNVVRRYRINGLGPD